MLQDLNFRYFCSLSGGAEAADAGSSAQDTQALDHAVEREEREALEELAREQKALQAVEKQLEQAQLESAETRRKLETALVRIAHSISAYVCVRNAARSKPILCSLSRRAERQTPDQVLKIHRHSITRWNARSVKHWKVGSRQGAPSCRPA